MSAAHDNTRALFDPADPAYWDAYYDNHKTPSVAPVSFARNNAQECCDELRAFAGERLPTGIPSLDAMCRGGILPARVLTYCGAPGACKTGLVAWQIFRWASAGHPVTFVAADEYRTAITIRLGQMLGLPREQLENGDSAAVTELEPLLGALPIRLVDPSSGEVLEDAAAELAARAVVAGKTGVLALDSVQTLRSRGSDAADSPRARVDAVCGAVREVTNRGRLITLVTSEVARNFYRQMSLEGDMNPLAAGKESGKIEYMGDVQLVLTSVKGSGDLIDVSVPKNRIKDPLKPKQLRLRWDFVCATVTEVERPAEATKAAATPEEELDEKTGVVLGYIVEHPGAPGKAHLAEALRLRERTVAVAVDKLLEEHRIENRGNKSKPRLHAI